MTSILVANTTASITEVDVRDYGAVGNGATNDTQAIQSAIEDAQESGNVVLLTPGDYLIDGLNITGAVEISGPGTLLCAVDIDYGIRVRLAWGDSTACTIANEAMGTTTPARYRTKVTAASHNLTRGQVLKFVANTTNLVGGGVGEMARVAEVIDANNFSLDRQLEDIAPGAASISYRAIPDDRIKLDVNFRRSGSDGAGNGNEAALVWLDGCVDPIVDIRAERVASMVCLGRSVFGGRINVTCQDSYDNQANTVYGYGIQLGGASCGVDCTVNMQGGRHAFTTASVDGFAYSTTQSEMAAIGHVRDCRVSGISHGSYAAAFDTHNGGRRIRFEHCVAVQPNVSEEVDLSSASYLPVGFQDRSIDTEYYNCRVVGGRWGWWLEADAHPATQNTRVKMVDCVASGCVSAIRIENDSTPGDYTLDIQGLLCDSGMGVVNAENCTIHANDVIFVCQETATNAFILAECRLFLNDCICVNSETAGGVTPISIISGSANLVRLNNFAFDYRYASNSWPRYLIKTSAGATATCHLSGLSTHGRNLTATIDPANAGTLTLKELNGTPLANVRDYGAVGNGTTNDTTAIQAAIDAAELWVTSGDSTGAEVYFPKGTYNHTGLTVNQNAIVLRGENSYASALHFTSASGTGIAFSKGASQLFNCGLRDISVKCTDTSSGSKIAVSISDASQFTLANVAITQCQGGDSTGLRLYGREMFRGRDLYINATIPIRLSANPNDSTTYISGDQFNFHNMYLIAHATDPATLTQACFLVDDVYIGNLSFTGYQAWVNRKHGFYYARSTTSRPVAHNLNLSGIRFEQADDNTGYNIYIDFNSASLQGQDVRIVNCKGTSENNGIYLRYIRDVLIDGWSKSGTLVALNVDRVSTLTGRALLITNGAASISMSDMRLAHGTRPADNTYDYVVDGVWHYETASTLYDSKPRKNFEADEWAWTGTLADDGLIQLPINSNTQKWLVARVEAMAMNAANDVIEHGTWVVGDVTTHATKGVVKVSGTTNTAAGNSDTNLCVYCNGTNPMESPIYVYNRLGYECHVAVHVIGKRDTTGL